MAYTTTRPTLAPEPKIGTHSTLETVLQAALEHARRLTEMYGTDNIEVAIAWEAVEELQVAKTRQKAAAQSAFAQYCAAHPDAPECRIYED